MISYRNFIEQYLIEHFIGPGYTKEIYECSNDLSDEIIDQPVTSLYSSGILKPRSTNGSTEEMNDDLDSDGDMMDNEEEEREGNIADNTDEINGNELEDRDKNKSDKNEYNEPETDNPFEHHCGLIACTSLDETLLDISVRYGRYHAIEEKDRHTIKLKLDYLYPQMQRVIEHYNNQKEIQEKLQTVKGTRKTFADYFTWDDKHATLSLAPIREKEPLLGRIIKAKDLTQLDCESNDARFLLNRLIQASFKGRVQCEKSYTWDLREAQKSVVLEGIEGCEKVVLHLQVYKTTKDCRYLKILVENKELVEGCADSSQFLCQVETTARPKSGKLIGYRDPLVDRSDKEQRQIEYLYREVKEYGKGIGCAVVWDEDGKWIKTTFAPSVDVKKSANSLDSTYCSMLNILLNENYFDSQRLEDSCNLLNLSHWTKYQDRREYIAQIEIFVKAYARWHKVQEVRAAQESEESQAVSEDILNKQKQLLQRLEDNVAYLRENDTALECFQYANTAMLIQMIIARDKNFAKNRDRSEVKAEKNVLDNLDYFKTNAVGYAYRPFQLAFLLMNVRSTMEQEDPYRTKGVDLIWFPTGGGKTEAYLALTALTIIYRRHCEERKEGIKPGGVSVIMRYTLRLLTTQQFERASYLICALEFMRNKIEGLNLGTKPITIGLWVGAGVTPNNYKDLEDSKGQYEKFKENQQGDNPYPVSCCPWCGSNLFSQEEETPIGYLDKGKLSCIQDYCIYNQNNGQILPIKFVDESIYAEPPTLLFATVDKFAGIHKHPELLGIDEKFLSPNLIIQDELHLISGPLGSMVGFFESAIDYLVTRQKERIPKIVASTATTRNTQALIHKLYKREVHIFPANGITYGDNFFSHIEQVSLRRHLGLSAQIPSVKAEIRIFAHLLLARLALMKHYLIDKKIDLANNEEVIKSLITDNYLRDDLDNYWSLVAYYTSLKELGRMRSRVTQEISHTMRSGKRYLNIPTAFDPLWLEITDQRIEEFTGRIDSLKIKGLLSKVEKKALFDNRLNPQQSPDIILATNMISVGIDISRWNMMLMSSLPCSTAEYIQSTSRIARSAEGLVVNLFSRRAVRSLSLYENYTAFHRSYYKYVEPLSITPLTRSLIQNKILNNILCCVKKTMPEKSLDEVKKEVVRILVDRFELNERMQDFLERELEEKEDKNDYASSLRDIEGNIAIRIKELNY